MARLRCPPPGSTITPTPVAFSLAGRYGRIDGLCTFVMAVKFRSGPSGLPISGVVLPSEPGAPLGQSGIALGASAAFNVEITESITTSIAISFFMKPPKPKPNRPVNLFQAVQMIELRSAASSESPKVTLINRILGVRGVLPPRPRHD